jgi:hypothetical protein
MNWIPAFAGMTDEEKINRGFRESGGGNKSTRFIKIQNFPPIKKRAG